MKRKVWRISFEKASRGQAFVELALILTLLIIIVASLIELGFMLNSYMALQDAARNAARFSSDGVYNSADSDHICATTKDFYRVTACLTNQELAQARPAITLTLNKGDDIVISVFAVQGKGYPGVTDPVVSARYPTTIDGKTGYSEALDFPGYSARNYESQITTAYVNSQLVKAAPSTGFLAVEIFYHYDQKLKLPWITAFMEDPFPLHAWALMPLVSAEPKAPTP